MSCHKKTYFLFCFNHVYNLFISACIFCYLHVMSRPWMYSTFRQLATKDINALQNKDLLPTIASATHICPHTKRGNLMNPTSQKPLLPNLSNQWRTHRGFDSPISTGTSPKAIKSLHIIMAKCDRLQGLDLMVASSAREPCSFRHHNSQAMVSTHFDSNYPHRKEQSPTHSKATHLQLSLLCPCYHHGHSYCSLHSS